MMMRTSHVGLSSPASQVTPNHDRQNRHEHVLEVVTSCDDQKTTNDVGQIGHRPWTHPSFCLHMEA